MRRSLSFIAAGLGLAVVLSGCGDSKPAAPAASSSASSAPATTAASSGSASAADWVNSYCGALTKLGDLSSVTPPNVSPGDLPGAKKALGDILTKAEDAFNDAIDQLGKLPPAPVAAGDKAKTDLVAGITPAQQAIKDAATKLAAAPASVQSIQAAGTAFQNIGTTLDKVSDPLAGLKAVPELAPSVTTAPNCKKLPPA